MVILELSGEGIKAMSEQKSFQQELQELINRHCKGNRSGTPDYILAEYLNNCLHNYDLAIVCREEWYGRKIK